MPQDLILQLSERISTHEKVQTDVTGTPEAGDSSLHRSAEIQNAISQAALSLSVR